MAAPQALTDWYTSQVNAAPAGQVTSPTPSAGGLLTDTSAKNPTAVTTSTVYSPATLPNPTNWNVTPDQTAAGQLNQITAQDSPLMQRAATSGLQLANSRGLLNSSMGVGAAQDAVLAAATPIAVNDAGVRAKSAGYNADTANTFAVDNTNATNTANSFAAQAANHASDFNATNVFTAQQSALDNQNKMDQTLASTTATLGFHLNDQITAINQDLNMNQAAKDYATQQLYDTYKSNVSMLTNIGKVPDVSALLVNNAPRVAPPAPDYTNNAAAIAAQNYQAEVNAAKMAAAQPQPQPQPKGGSMICTRMHDIGVMDDYIYRADDLYARWLEYTNPDFLYWYQSWAIHFVNAMHGRTMASRFLIKSAWRLIVNPWSTQMAYEVGYLKKGSKIGRFIMKSAEKLYLLTRKTQ